MSATPEEPLPETSQMQSKVLTLDDGRQVGYGLVNPQLCPEKHHTTAIVFFTNMSGCSLQLQLMAASLSNYRCSVVLVDRPGCGATSPLLELPNTSSRSEEDLALHRIRGSTKDVLAVLQHEGLERVYVLGVCIGHPYAIELCRRLLSSSNETTASSSLRHPKLEALTLVAPFVSPACPAAWSVARLGASVPSWMLRGALSCGSALAPIAVHLLLSPSAVKKKVTEEERVTYGWTEEDFVEVCAWAGRMGEMTKNMQNVEARVGVASSWQAEICDRFAEEVGCGLNNADAEEEEASSVGCGLGCKKTDNVCSDSGDNGTVLGKPLIPIAIYASPDDELATFSSVEWIAKRCYSGSKFIRQEKIHSHMIITMLGGPPRNPVLLHTIAQDWGLLDSNHLG